MARGFLSGVAAGGVVGLVAVGVVSVMAPPPVAPTVEDAAPGVAAPERVTRAGSGENGSDADRAVQTGRAGQPSPAPDRDTLAAIDPGTLDSTRKPETGAGGDLNAPAADSEPGAVELQPEEPLLPSPQALAPQAPQAADDLSITTEPAQPSQPQAGTESVAFAAPDAPETAPDAPNAESPAPLTGETGTVPEGPETVDAPSIVTQTPAAPAAPGGADTLDDPAQADAEAQAPQADLAKRESSSGNPAPTAPSAVAEAPVSDPAPNPDTEPPEVEVASAPASTEAAVPSDRPSIGTPAVNLINRESEIVIRRSGLDGAAAEPSETVETASATALPPFKAYAQPFEPEEDKPLMSIVLIDTGTSAVSGSAGLAALKSFPYPLTFAVDSALPDATERMQLYRSAGFEVLAMVDLPDGARAEDVETTFAAVLPRLPEIVGVLGAQSGNLQLSRDVSDQVTQVLAQSGHGWVTQAKGLNTASTLARREGVPAAPIFRDFDSKGQTAVVIRRFLDQAAFKAGQESGVIMLGRMRPETVSALLLWSLQDRAGQVALAPITAVLGDPG